MFVFETRNPRAREWERWTPEHGVEFRAADGTTVRFEAAIETPVTDDVVRFTATYSSAGWERPEPSRSVLRFLDAATLSQFLTQAGFIIEHQFGAWNRSPVVDTSLEIVARLLRFPGYSQTRQKAKDRFAWAGFRFQEQREGHDRRTRPRCTRY